MKTDSQAYQEKLKDPRWQKVRLKTFERDNWKCMWCAREDRQLHLHHKQYTTTDPWNELPENLVTVCVDCHSAEHGFEVDGDQESPLQAPPASVKLVKDCMVYAIADIQALYENRGSITGIPTGFNYFDKMTDGLHAGEMVVIASRPSMGKTAFALNIAEYVAVSLKLPVFIFTLEMNSQQIVQRLICSRARVNLGRVRDGFHGDRDYPALQAAAVELAEAKLYVDDTSAPTIHELSRRLRYFVDKHSVAFAVIDYLQLVRSGSRRARENRQVEIAEVSAGIKELAKELKIPILVLSQLNRNPESRTGDTKGLPRLSDLRESGCIEQDADLVGLLYRDEYYAETEYEREECHGKAMLIIAKQRNGPVGDVPLVFLKEFTRFENTAPSHGED